MRSTVQAATLDLLRERGDDFGIPQVAARAGVHDTTIYRRWGNRDALIVDAVRAHLGDVVPVLDSGSLHGDLIAFLARSAAFLTSSLGSQLVRATIGMEEPTADSPRASYWPDRLAQIAVIVERAVERGELPRAASAEATFVAEMLLAPLYFRLLVSGDALDQEALEQIAKFVVRALAGSDNAANAGRRAGR